MSLDAPTEPTFDVVVICCKAGLVNHDGSLKSALPPAAWRMWLRLRFAVDARYKAQVLNALRYVKANPQPKAYGKRGV